VKRPTGANTKAAKEKRHDKKQHQEEYVPPPQPASRSNMLTVEAQGAAFISALRFLYTKIEHDGGLPRQQNNR
jgi:hypothetical protein